MENNSKKRVSIIFTFAGVLFLIRQLNKTSGTELHSNDYIIIGCTIIIISIGILSYVNTTRKKF
jgi:hypothetical protein